jgi:hypothetical protein
MSNGGTSKHGRASRAAITRGNEWAVFSFIFFFLNQKKIQRKSLHIARTLPLSKLHSKYFAQDKGHPNY